MVRLIFGDCLKLLYLLPDNSVDMVLADLPFGTTQCLWDTPIDLKLLWFHLDRVCKNNAAKLFFAQTPFDKILGCSNLEELRYEWIWEKTAATGHYNAKKMPMKAHENILVFYKQLPIYNPQKTCGHRPVNTFTKRIGIADRTEVYGKSTQEITGGGSTERFPRSVIVFKSDKQLCRLHSTQKPLALCKYFIETYTNAGDVVLDMTCGSGTTGVASEEINRNCILMENDIIEYNKAKKRLALYGY